VKIGVISDTHLNGLSSGLKKIIEQHFGDTDMILHAGDIVEIDVLKAFSGRNLKAVCGNMDSSEIKRTLPPKRVIKVDRFRIGLIHGHGGYGGIEKKIREEFEDVDCIVFGHTHAPENRIIDGVLFFNPGALVKKYQGGEGSLGILELNDTIRGRIIKV